MFIFNFLCFILYHNYVNTNAIEVTDDTLDTFLVGKKLVLINFYASWCPYSSKFLPTYDDAAKIIHKEYPNVALMKVNGQMNMGLMQKFSVNKFPTVLILENGENKKKEFHGQRTVESLTQFVSSIMNFSPIQHTSPELTNLPTNSIIAFMDSASSEEFTLYKKIAGDYRDDCKFYFFVRTQPSQFPSESMIFIPPRTTESHSTYRSSLLLTDEMTNFIQTNCKPFVREITFENVQEIASESKPLLIFFYNNQSSNQISQFKTLIASIQDKVKDLFSVVLADGNVFSHALLHIGTTYEDLPEIAIDDMRHIYPYGYFETLTVEGILKFIDKFNSGILHQDFHRSNSPPHPERRIRKKISQDSREHVGSHDHNEHPHSHEEPSTTNSNKVDSVFRKVAVDPKHYSFLHYDDEL